MTLCFSSLCAINVTCSNLTFSTAFNFKKILLNKLLKKMWLCDGSFQNFLTPEISKRHFNIQFQLWAAAKTHDFNNNKKKSCEEKGFGLFQTYILRRDFFPGFWSYITIRIFNTSNISEFCYSSGWHFLQKPQMYINKLKPREKHITGVKRDPSFHLHSGFSFRFT